MIYPPEEDSYLLEKYVKKFAKNLSVLDMGSGSGIQAQAALNAKAKSVIASDIDPKVISRLKKLKIPSIKSNLFSNIKSKFDLIIFNPPYLPEDKREPDDAKLSNSGGKKGDEIILRFLKQAPRHLNRGGIILLITSTLTPKKRIFQLLKTLKLKKTKLSTTKGFFEIIELWKINQ
jgi:release factor glutamine methyltransferase